MSRKERGKAVPVMAGCIAALVGIVALVQFLALPTGTPGQNQQHLPGLMKPDLRGLHQTKADAEAVTRVMPDVNKDWRPHKQPVQLQLRLPPSVLKQPALQNERSMFRQYGFNLNLSNHLPLAQPWPDYRNDACKKRKWPPPEKMPKVSVIIIFYNEPLSTLLRNVVGVLNRSPSELIGEIILVDDHSKLDELAFLPEHLERLQRQLPPGKVRLVRRSVHNGIVGARNQGAKEAKYQIIVILDSHAQVCDGWLEPLVSRIYEDRRRVVVPNLSGIDVHSMELIKGGTWPPNRGIFNWRLTFDIVRADPVLDIIETDVDKKASAIKSPVMPGGLFAMDREYYFELGGYDPEILYYGAEHVEMSFRIWTCGGSMEISPCSNIGHVYREFDRFGVDPQLEGVHIGHVLDRNDGRVAETWMDEYKKLFFAYRPMTGMDLGDLKSRKELRRRLQCKPFQWYITNICRTMYEPDFDPSLGFLVSGAEAGGYPFCLDSRHQMDGPADLRPCYSGVDSKALYLSSKGYIEYSTTGVRHICIRLDLIQQMPCGSATTWAIRQETSEIESLEKPGLCLGRVAAGLNEEFRLAHCGRGASTIWLLQKAAGPEGSVTLSDPDFAVCLDNMQRREGHAELGTCHGGATQQWTQGQDGKLSSIFQRREVCLGISAEVGLGLCLPDDPGCAWKYEDQRLKPALLPDLCMESLPQEAGSEGPRASVRPCSDGTSPTRDKQTWRWLAKQ